MTEYFSDASKRPTTTILSFARADSVGIPEGKELPCSIVTGLWQSPLDGRKQADSNRDFEKQNSLSMLSLSHPKPEPEKGYGVGGSLVTCVLLLHHTKQ